MSINTPLQNYANQLISNGWVVISMTDQQIVATRKKDINGFVALLGFIGLFIYCIPGLLIFIAGYLARGTDSRVVTVTEAENWAIQKNNEAQEARERNEARALRKQQKHEELMKSENPLSFWYEMSSNQQIIIIFLLLAMMVAVAFVFLTITK